MNHESATPRGWHKSSYSGNPRQECVEVRETPTTALVRDTQNRRAGHLAFSIPEWSAFIVSVKRDEI
ncbi:DUF397 domain-containing protein [Marinitenerispora sediminis]|uniref:DUF397 domain-containing protein n=2 Tax=Marinitenerispora sediminis TaxID=1931232 RepID=A0A368T6C8_9ACTN|nr:DUF397 domain-containing protein [Marinitenerispora sediminis]RCV55973.1 DUF397 domain-containing protein [Marinitenerispora sediminis]RCV56271.1 DUF397 domain-containing protein [Marinitenerispora sediminis]RCV61203.1 DUF397 domain-containing protein [Marinitenerispora sediminis]